MTESEQLSPGGTNGVSPRTPRGRSDEEPAVSDMQQVVVNDEDQYSLWPRDARPPAGWRPEGFTGSRQECLDHIDAVWTDMRPRSTRERGAGHGPGGGA